MLCFFSLLAWNFPPISPYAFILLQHRSQRIAIFFDQTLAIQIDGATGPVKPQMFFPMAPLGGEQKLGGGGKVPPPSGDLEHVVFEIIWIYFFLWEWRFIWNVFMFKWCTPFILVLMHLVVFFPTLFFLLGKPHKKQQRHPSHICNIPASQMPRYVLSERFLHSKRKRAGLRSIPQAVMSGALMLSNLEFFAEKFCLRLMTLEWKSEMAMRFFRRLCRE